MEKQKSGGAQFDMHNQQLSQTVDKLQTQVREQRDKIKHLDAENGFYHKLNYLLDTMRKVMEIEKGLCYKLANANNKKNQEDKVEQFESGIQKCKD